jgi:RNA polymerase sigma factor for flagellar operon FliA
MRRISPRIRESRPAAERPSSEVLLWHRFRRTQNPRLREQLVLAYAPLVHGIAKRIHRRLPPHLDRQDLVSSGMIGLLAAVDGYDPERSTMFVAYAAPRIFGAMIDWLRKNDCIPPSARRRGEDLQVLSLEEPVERAAGDQGKQPCLLELLPDEQAPDPEECVVTQETVRLALEALPPREREIVVLHHFADVPLPTLAAAVGLSPRRVWAIHSHAIAHLELLLDDPCEADAVEDACIDASDGGGASMELARPNALTPPELDVLRAAADGMSAEETAQRLTKSAGTVRAQRKSVRVKLRARNMAQAVWLACKKGYLRPAA